MEILNQQFPKRTIGRRKDDFNVRDRNSRLRQIINVGQIITSEMNLDLLFEVIMEQTNIIMGTERSTLFLYDEETDELWSLAATGMETNVIRINANSGVAGSVFQNRSSLVINDVYEDPRFFSEIDSSSGFRTQNIICIPIVNRNRHCIGVLQALNKDPNGFKEDDLELLNSISYYVAIALENSKLYEEVKGYSEELEKTLLHIETLEQVKSQLTKFVPSTVAKLAEEDPDQLTDEKISMDVTILFLDIQGFSSLTEGFDQRLVNDMVERHFSKYLECIGRHGGEINETSGDGLMVMFKDGNVELHSKEAVAAGLEIVSKNAELNNELTYPWGKVMMHLGINSGEALVGSTKMKSLAGERWTYTASGLVTVLAARIGSLSHENRLYIGPETYQYVKDSYYCEFVGSRKLKNVQDPIPVYWVKQTD